MMYELAIDCDMKNAHMVIMKYMALNGGGGALINAPFDIYETILINQCNNYSKFISHTHTNHI